MSVVAYNIDTPTAAVPGRYVRPDHPYPQGGWVILPDGRHPIYLGHPDAACAVCDKALGNRKHHHPHPADDSYVVLCGGGLMRFVL